jgi:hypothetical protein
MSVQHELIQEGCFVFQVLRADKVFVRTIPELDNEEPPPEENHFENNELLAIDLIQPTNAAVFLRLADQSGWVVAEECGELYLRQIPVEKGLFTFYVDNVPHGQSVRRHPMDDTSELLNTENCSMVLAPMTRIYCDYKVTHPVTHVNFYRLQNHSMHAPPTPGWVRDRQPSQNEKERDVILLLPIDKVKEGLFAFKPCCGGMAIRDAPNCTEHSKNGKAVQADEIIMADVVRESPFKNGNGPFLRLSDQSGWLFEKKLGQQVMERVPIEMGLWNFKVLNEPVGLGLRSQPVDRQDKVVGDPYLPGMKIECDRKVVQGDGVCFYRVIGTNGWVFDKRNNKPMLELLSQNVRKSKIPDVVQPWDVEFVRGVASVVRGTKELSYDERTNVLNLETVDGTQVHVFCRSHSVVVVFKHPIKGKTKECRRKCTPQELYMILTKDIIETMTSFENECAAKAEHDEEDVHAEFDEEKKDDFGDISQAMSTERRSAIEKEEELRKGLLACDADIAKMQAHRRNLIKSLKGYDNERNAVAIDRNFEVLKVQSAEEASVLSKPGSEVKAVGSDNSLVDYASPRSQMSPQSRSGMSEASRIQRERAHVCGDCLLTFSGKYSRDLHCRTVHGLYCKQCDRIFASTPDLEAHKDIAGHWPITTTGTGMSSIS